MSAKWTLVTAATIGAMAAAVALATGGPGAKADELSELRANHQLLQQKLDQITRAPPGSGAGYESGPANSAATGGSFPRSFLIPGTATSVRVGGNITEIFREKP